MELKDQVCSSELARSLEELGIKQESLWYWQFVDYEYDGVLVMQKKFELVLKESINLMLEHYSAFTVAELGEMLPFSILRKYKEVMPYITDKNEVERLFLHQYPPFEGNDCYEVAYLSDGSVLNHNEKANTEADARAKMLIYLLENKLMGEK